MKTKTSELAGKALRYAVALASGATGYAFDTIATYWMRLDGKDIALNGTWAQAFKPDENWAHGGPIIEQMPGSIVKHWIESSEATRFETHLDNMEGTWIEFGPTELVSRLRCYVAWKLGDEVDVPEELL